MVFPLAILTGLVMGYLTWLLIPQQWESESYIEGGTIGIRDLEGVDVLALRLRSPRTFQEVALRIRAEGKELIAASLLDSTRIIELPRVVGLRVKASRGEDAVKISQYFLEEVTRQQAELIPILRKQAASLENHAGQVASAGGPVSRRSTRNEPLVTCWSGWPSSDAEIVPTHFSIEPACSSKPVSPSLRLLILAGGLCGLCFAMVYVVRSGSNEDTG